LSSSRIDSTLLAIAVCILLEVKNLYLNPCLKTLPRISSLNSFLNFSRANSLTAPVRLREVQELERLRVPFQLPVRVLLMLPQCHR
jgi:hypothetical protein